MVRVTGGAIISEAESGLVLIVVAPPVCRRVSFLAMWHLNPDLHGTAVVAKALSGRQEYRTSLRPDSVAGRECTQRSPIDLRPELARHTQASPQIRWS